MKKFSKIIVAVLTIAMLSVSFVGCGLIEDTEKVEKVKIQKETMLTVGDGIEVNGAYYGWFFENAYLRAQSEATQASQPDDAMDVGSSAEIPADSAAVPVADSAADSTGDVAPENIKVDIAKVKQEAINDIVAVKMACLKAKEAGIVLTDEDYKNIDSQQKAVRSQLTSIYSQYGDVTYSDILLGLNTNIETVNQIIEDEYLAGLYYASLKSEGYITAKHILVKYNDDVHTKEEAQTIANDIKAQLDGGADFDTLMNEKSEDGRGADGKLSSPHYTFAKDGSMVAPFEEAAFALEEGEISDIVLVESDSYSGFHIIKRVPLSLSEVYNNYSEEELDAEQEKLVKDVKVTESKKISYYSKDRN